MKPKWSSWMMAALACAACLGATAEAAKKTTEVVCKVESDRSVLPAGQAERTVLKVSLGAPDAPNVKNRPSVNLCLVLDHSGSMGGGKMEQAKEAAITALRRLDKQDFFSLVIYDHEVETLVPAQRAENLEWIEARIRSIEARGSTALFAGVSQGAAEIRKNLDDRHVSRILLLSDGLANVGPSSSEDLGRLGTSLRKENVSVTTIGVGTDYNEDLMARLAQQSDGNTYFVENSRDLPRIFAAELGDVLSVVAREVRIVIECTEDVRPIRIIGRDGRIDGQQVELSLNQLYGGQEKYILVEVEVPATDEGRDRQLAVARCEYENLLTRKPAVARGSSRVTFSRADDKVQASVNAPVVKVVVLNEAAAAKDDAIRLVDENRPAEAASVLRSRSVELRLSGEKYADPDLLEEAKKMESSAARAEQNNLPNDVRKEMKASSYQYRNQQENQ